MGFQRSRGTRRDCAPYHSAGMVVRIRRLKVIVYLSVLISLIGLLIYGFAGNPKTEQVGLHMFWVGLLAFLINAPVIKDLPLVFHH